MPEPSKELAQADVYYDMVDFLRATIDASFAEDASPDTLEKASLRESWHILAGIDRELFANYVELRLDAEQPEAAGGTVEIVAERRYGLDVIPLGNPNDAYPTVG